MSLHAAYNFTHPVKTGQPQVLIVLQSEIKERTANLPQFRCQCVRNIPARPEVPECALLLPALQQVLRSKFEAAPKGRYQTCSPPLLPQSQIPF